MILLTFSCIITEKGQTCLKYLVVNAAKFLKVCLTILGHYAVKDSERLRINSMFLVNLSPLHYIRFKHSNVVKRGKNIKLGWINITSNHISFEIRITVTINLHFFSK